MIETKTATFTAEHVARTRAAAAHVQQLRPVVAPAVPVIVVCRADESPRWIGDTFVVTVEQVTASLRRLATSLDVAA